MFYYKINVSLNNTNKKVYREFYVNQNVSLYDFGLAIAFSFRATMEHLFYFSSSKTNCVYEDEVWLVTEDLSSSNRYIDYKDVTINHLAKHCKKLDFIYDTGEGYRFSININNNLILVDSDRRIIVNKAKGYGIFEDDREILEEFTKSSDKKLKEFYNDSYLPLGLRLDLDATSKDYFKTLSPKQILKLMDDIDSEFKEMYFHEGKY